METSAGAATVSVVPPLTEFRLAEIVELPCATLLAKPVGLTAATPGMDELQATTLVRFSVLPFVKVPVAINCCLFPRGIEGLAGVTVIDFRPLTVPVPVKLTTLGLPKAP
jgi:hypothetical protein